MTQVTKCAAEKVREQIATLLTAWGMDADIVKTTAEVMVETDLDAAIDVLHETPPVDPALPVLVPGDPERASRAERLKNGIPMPATLLEKIRVVCEKSKVPFLL